MKLTFKQDPSDKARINLLADKRILGYVKFIYDSDGHWKDDKYAAFITIGPSWPWPGEFEREADAKKALKASVKALIASDAFCDWVADRCDELRREEEFLTDLTGGVE